VAGYPIPWTLIRRDRLVFCRRGFHALHTVAGFTEIFELFSLHYDDIPGQRISLLTAHSSGRSMSYRPNVSMSRPHKAAGLGEFLVTVYLSAMGSAFTRGLSYGHFLTTSYLPPDWFEWPRWNTPHCSLNATKSSSPQFPQGNRYRLLNRGVRLNPNYLLKGATSRDCS
jgi:hypothetical protein